MGRTPSRPCAIPVNELPCVSFYPEPWGQAVIGMQQGWDLRGEAI